MIAEAADLYSLSNRLVPYPKDRETVVRAADRLVEYSDAIEAIRPKVDRLMELSAEQAASIQSVMVTAALDAMATSLLFSEAESVIERLLAGEDVGEDASFLLESIRNRRGDQVSA